MSENIQSISQGTFTIGSNSALNFEAGPGITITEPTAGTVRIGNDETVLWSGTNFVESGTTAHLSDNIDNYNEVKVCYNPIYTKGIEYQFEVPGSANSYRFSVISQDTNVYQTILSLQIQGNEFYIQRSRGITFNTTNNTWSTRTVSPTGGFAEGIYKIVGINRKEV